MILDVVKIPNKVLEMESKPVTEMTPEILELIENMAETMYFADGIGLAAVQVGILLKIIVIDIKDLEEEIKKEKTEDKNEEKMEIKKTPLIFINPKIIWKSKEIKQMEEGCLSVPEYRDEVNRHLTIEVEFQDIELKTHKIKADGLLAHCLQHEIDHTNGVVFIDYLNKEKRDIALTLTLALATRQKTYKNF